jgi:hypothetical protein
MVTLARACEAFRGPMHRRTILALLVVLGSPALAACRGSAAASGNDVDAGDISDGACVIPSMLDEYPDSGLPTPYAPGIPAPPCVVTQHDAIMVLGCPNDDDGGASDCQRARTDIAVAAEHAGLGDAFITSGAAVHNMWVEADTLKSLLVARGVPQDAVTTETRANHTDENIYYSSRIMQSKGWTTAIVVSDSPSHLELTATCDSNCCVDLGRLTVFDFTLPDGDGGTFTQKLGHYELYPSAAPVTPDECTQIEQPSKLMCLALPSRLACANNFMLPAP